MEPFQPKLGVRAASIEALVTPPPAFDMLVFDPEGCIHRAQRCGAPLRKYVLPLNLVIIFVLP
jgi:hypothetical protein